MKYPIGIQSFESLINDGYIYVDKTALIYQLVHTGRYYFLSRPRRFERVCSSAHWKPTSTGSRNCSRDWKWNGSKKNGRNIRYCIWI